MTWHADHDLLAAYCEDRLDHARASSVEAHLIGCAACRADVAAGQDTARLDRVWSAVLDRVDVPRPWLLQRLLARCGIAPHSVRLVAAVPAARLAWVFGVAVTILIAAGFAGAAGRATAILLMLAPLMPLTAVALAFNRSADPAYEVALATPIPALRLLLVRTTAVLVGSLVAGAVAALAIPGVGWEAAGWLLPGLTLASASLALASWLPLPVGVAVAGASWLALISAVVAATGTRVGPGLTDLMLAADSQVGFAALAALALTVIIARRDAFESLNLRRTV
ncbi:MAG: zf-HC2 domain-containing protein [Geodermatophilaceae bacterium]|nr:zf-HC2 domain-containing protein [Geodermatophilaceae bacterium]